MDGSFVSIAEQQTYLRFLKFGQREDGRAAFDYRDWTVAYGKHSGTCVTTLGNTTILCSANVVPVRTTRPNQIRGLSKIDVEISPLSFPKFQPGRRRLRILRRQLRQHVKSSVFWSKCVDDESLCIARGKAVFLVNLFIEVIHADGNLFDAVILASVACLLTTKRPEILVDRDKIIALSTYEKAPISLQINHIPVSTTFGFQKSSHFLIVDPSAKEETVLNGSLSIAVNQNGEICGTYKRGSAVLPADTIVRCSEIAAMRATEVATRLRELSEADAKMRSDRKPLDFVVNLRLSRAQLPESKTSSTQAALAQELSKLAVEMDAADAAARVLPKPVLLVGGDEEDDELGMIDEEDLDEDGESDEEEIAEETFGLE